MNGWYQKSKEGPNQINDKSRRSMHTHGSHVQLWKNSMIERREIERIMTEGTTPA